MAKYFALHLGYHNKLLFLFGCMEGLAGRVAFGLGIRGSESARESDDAGDRRCLPVGRAGRGLEPLLWLLAVQAVADVELPVLRRALLLQKDG